jgi:hypothetical protein
MAQKQPMQTQRYKKNLLPQQGGTSSTQRQYLNLGAQKNTIERCNHERVGVVLKLGRVGSRWRCLGVVVAFVCGTPIDQDNSTVPFTLCGMTRRQLYDNRTSQVAASLNWFVAYCLPMAQLPSHTGTSAERIAIAKGATCSSPTCH